MTDATEAEKREHWLVTLVTMRNELELQKESTTFVTPVVAERIKAVNAFIEEIEKNDFDERLGKVAKPMATIIEEMFAKHSALSSLFPPENNPLPSPRNRGNTV